MSDEAIGVVATGSIISFNASSSRVAIPNDSSGTLPKYIRLVATQACFAKLGGASVNAASGDLMIKPADRVVLKTLNQTYIAAVQVSAGGVLQISPLEDR